MLKNGWSPVASKKADLEEMRTDRRTARIRAGWLRFETCLTARAQSISLNLVGALDEWRRALALGLKGAKEQLKQSGSRR